MESKKRADRKLRYISSLYAGAAAHNMVYSGNVNGAVLASFCLKGTVAILHGSAGCALHYRNIHRQGNIILDDLIFTDLNESDFIYGGAEKLRRKIIETYEKYSPQRIIVIPTDPILVISEDIRLVLSDLSNQIDCDLLYADIKTVSQPYTRWNPTYELQLSDEEVKAEEQREKTETEMERRAFGCGYADVFRPLVEKYMKPLPRDDKLLVVGGFPTTRKTATFMDSVRNELGEFGLKVLSLDEPVDEATFAQAAAAKYSFGFFWNCGYTLKRLFGVEILSDVAEGNLIEGLAGLEKYYLSIIKLFELGEKAEEKIISKRRRTEMLIRDAGATFSGKSSALCINHPNMIWWNTRMIQSILNSDVRYILLTTKDRATYTNMQTDKDIETMIRRSLARLKESTDQIPELLVDPSPEQLDKAVDEVDYFLGRGDHFPTINDKQRGVTGLPEIQNSFDDYVEYLITYTARVRENDRRPLRLLKDRLTESESINVTSSKQMSFRLR